MTSPAMVFRTQGAGSKALGLEGVGLYIQAHYPPIMENEMENKMEKNMENEMEMWGWSAGLGLKAKGRVWLSRSLALL